MAAETIPVTFVQQFSDALFYTASQRRSKLRGSVMVDSSLTGERKWFDRLAPRRAKKSLTRHGTTPINESTWSRRALDPVDWEDGELIDSFDRLKMLIDPTDKITTRMREAFDIETDQTVIDAFKAAVVTKNVDGTFGSATFPAAQTVAVGTTGLTVAKIESALELLNANNVPTDDGELYMAISSVGLKQLQADADFKSFDFNNSKPLATGQAVPYLGFKFIVFGTNADTGAVLPKTGDNRSCFAWHKNGMQLAFAKQPSIMAAQNPERKYNWHAYASMSLGAIRMEEVQIVEVLIDETK